MIKLVLLSVLVCPITKKINTTKVPFNDKDLSALVSASQSCGKIYPDAPCLIEFRKHVGNHYSAICGRSR